MKNTFKLVYLFCLLSACNVGHKHNVDKAEALLEEGKKLEQTSQPDSAILVYQHAISLLSRTDEDALKGELYNKLGDVLMMENLFDRAVQAHSEALKYNQRLEDKTAASRSLRGLGKDYLLMEKNNLALSYFLQAQSYSSLINDQEEIALIHNNLAVIYDELRKHSLSVNHLKISLELTKDSTLIYKNYLSMGSIYRNLAYNDSAAYYFHLGTQSINIYTKASSYTNLSEMNDYLGDSKALEYSRMYELLKDSIEKGRRTEIIEQNELKNSFRKKLDKSRSKLLLLIGVSIGVISIIIYWSVKRHKAARMQAEEEISKRLLKEEEVRALEEKLNQMQIEYKETMQKLVEMKSKPDFNETKAEYDALIRKKEEEKKSIISAIDRIGRNCAKLFIKTEIYRKTKDKVSGKECVLKAAEQKELIKHINEIFKGYIQQLNTYLELTEDDYVYCCLFLSGFTNNECAVCRSISASAIRTRRSRLKNKVISVFGDDTLFNSIFLSKLQ